MSVIDAIGNTPLVEIRKLWSSDKTGVRILAKLEGSNPGGSIKDRPAHYMVRAAIASGELTQEKVILEPTSGNTGIGLAMIAAALGYRVKLVMPSCVSQERRDILTALGAELELTPGHERTDGAIRRARHIMEQQGGGYYMPNQFSNPANWRAHYETTAPEIARQTGGQLDLFVAGMGTTGTLMGASRYYRENGGRVTVVGVEPMLDHRIQGLKNMRESIVPELFDPSLLDRRMLCTDDDAFETVRDMALSEGLFCGLSSGAAMWAALRAARDLPRGSTVVVICPDRGDRYLSTEVFRSTCAQCPP